MDSIIKTGGGTFDPFEKNIYFIASGEQRLVFAENVNDHLLIAVNEIGPGDSIDFLDRWFADPNKRIFLDSGIFNLATSHASKYNISMDTALSLPPKELDGFEELQQKYINLVRRYGERLWGYIEIDQGGRENKIKTRTKLEGLGLRPIPVYHPLNDGWDYFDYLAERYDRICFGNVVRASAPDRRRLLATAWERHRRYPHLWIHFLGFTPNQWFNAFPMNSADSSSWLHPLRFPSYPIMCDGQTFAQMGKRYVHLLQKDGGETYADDGSVKAVRLCGYSSRMNMLTWRRHMEELYECGFESYPPLNTEVRHG